MSAEDARRAPACTGAVAPPGPLHECFACLTILPTHQHRHLWQAEQVRDALSAA